MRGFCQEMGGGVENSEQRVESNICVCGGGVEIFGGFIIIS